MCKNMKKSLRHFSLIHLGLAVLLAGMLAMRALSQRLYETVGFHVPTCVLHDIFRLYCPFCGGTRAVSALLTGNIVGALRANAAVVVTLPFLLHLDIRALVRIVRNKPVTPLSRPAIIALITVFAAFFVLRNVLLRFGINPTGDFIV